MRKQKERFEKIRVSVVIPTYNGSKKIKDPLLSLLRGTRVPDEIIILDESDDDGTESVTKEIQKQPFGDRIRYVPATTSGLCAHRNEALKETTGDFIVSIDDDVVVEKSWL